MTFNTSPIKVFSLVTFFLILQVYGQEKHGHDNRANHYMNQADFESLTRRFESPERDAYQKPEKILEYIGDVSGETIMDIGSGTGYFSFRLAEAGAKVIAADVDERFQEYIRIKKERLGIPDSELTLRKIPYDNPQLEAGEVDKVITVNTYHHIEDRSVYFAKVRSGLKPGGTLIVIDYFKKDLPVGPPKSMKIDRETIVKELMAAGFKNIVTNDTLLEYQFIITAR